MPTLPKFKTEEEFAAFVDTNDTASYWSELNPVEAGRFRVKRRRQTAVRVSVTPTTLKKLKALAAKRNVPLAALLQECLTERAKQERPVATS